MYKMCEIDQIETISKNFRQSVKSDSVNDVHKHDNNLIKSQFYFQKEIKGTFLNLY